MGCLRLNRVCGCIGARGVHCWILRTGNGQSWRRPCLTFDHDLGGLICKDLHEIARCVQYYQLSRAPFLMRDTHDRELDKCPAKDHLGAFYYFNLLLLLRLSLSLSGLVLASARNVCLRFGCHHRKLLSLYLSVTTILHCSMSGFPYRKVLVLGATSFVLSVHRLRSAHVCTEALARRSQRSLSKKASMSSPSEGDRKSWTSLSKAKKRKLRAMHSIVRQSSFRAFELTVSVVTKLDKIPAFAQEYAILPYNRLCRLTTL